MIAESIRKDSPHAHAPMGHVGPRRSAMFLIQIGLLYFSEFGYL